MGCLQPAVTMIILHSNGADGLQVSWPRLTSVGLLCREAIAQLDQAIHEVDKVQQPRVNLLGSEVLSHRTQSLQF